MTLQAAALRHNIEFGTFKHGGRTLHGRGRPTLAIALGLPSRRLGAVRTRARRCHAAQRLNSFTCRCGLGVLVLSSLHYGGTTKDLVLSLPGPLSVEDQEPMRQGVQAEWPSGLDGAPSEGRAAPLFVVLPAETVLEAFGLLHNALPRVEALGEALKAVIRYCQR